MCQGVFPPADFDVDKHCVCNVSGNVRLLSGSEVNYEPFKSCSAKPTCVFKLILEALKDLQ